MSKPVQLLSQIELFPVLSITPFHFDESFYPFKKKVTDERLYQYWKSVMRKNGLPNLEPIRKGSNFIRIRDVDEASLERLIDLRLEEDFHFDEEEGVFSFDGGVVLMNADEVIVTPQCCVSLEDYREWTSIDRHADFERIWIGHPWMYYRVEEETLYLTRLIEKTMDKTSWRHYNTADNSLLLDASDFEEKTDKALKETDLKYAIKFEEIQKALDKMQVELMNFKNRIVEVLEKKGQAKAKEIADCFINGNGKFLSYDPNDNE